MATLKLKRTDQYANGNTITVNGITRLIRRKRVYIESKKDKLRFVREGDTWQSIAKQEYGDAKYYHYLLDVNGVKNPFTTLTIGTEIIIPDLVNY